jgi:hypothetical protein
MMREIRDELSKEMMNMTFEEQKRYIEESMKPKSELSPHSSPDHL